MDFIRFDCDSSFVEATVFVYMPLFFCTSQDLQRIDFRIIIFLLVNRIFFTPSCGYVTELQTHVSFLISIAIIVFFYEFFNTSSVMWLRLYNNCLLAKRFSILIILKKVFPLCELCDDCLGLFYGKMLSHTQYIHTVFPLCGFSDV